MKKIVVLIQLVTLDLKSKMMGLIIRKKNFKLIKNLMKDYFKWTQEKILINLTIIIMK